MSCPVRVWVIRSSALAMPKSMIFTTPSKLTRTLAGVKSRWTTESGVPSAATSECAAVSPAQICEQMKATVRSAKGSWLVCASFRRRESATPWTSSVAR
ncbi:MAG: hypothetical protein QM820_34415 [Minicystis sp.]